MTSVTYSQTWPPKNVLVILLVLQFISSSYAQIGDTWIQKSSLPSNGRAAAVSFVIGDKAYMGTGMHFTSSGFALSDFWEYDPLTDVWTQVADYGGGGRGGAVAFVAGEKGYTLTGADNSATKKKDMWEYDPVLNTWTQKADLPGDGRNYAVAFTVGNKGYIATGYGASAILNDCWQYNRDLDTWTQKANVPGIARSSAIGFGIVGKGYVGTGYTAGNTKDFYAYDTLLDSWTQMANVGSTSRSGATSFVLNGHGFVCAGLTNAGYSDDLLEYDPVTDTWTLRASFIGSGKEACVGFSMGDYGYAGMGYDNQFNQTNGLYQYVPDTTIATSMTAIAEHPKVITLTNPFTDGATITILSSGKVGAELISPEGKRIPSSHFTKQSSGNTETIFRFIKNDLPSGIYLFVVNSEAGVLACEKIIVE